MVDISKGLVLGLIFILIGVVSIQAITESVATATETVGYTEETVTTADTSAALVALWSFNLNNSTDAIDSSGYGNDGAVTNATWTSDGVFGGAYEFDGSADYINCGNTASLNTTGNITVSAWFNADEIVAERHIVSKKWNSYAPYTQFIVFVKNSKVEASYGDGTDAYGCSETILANTTYHVVLVVSPNDRATLYLDGAQVDEDIDVSVDGNVTTFSLYIGTSAENGDTAFKGMIDEVRVYNRSISSEEVLILYQNGRNGRTLAHPSVLASSEKIYNSTETFVSGTDYSLNDRTGAISLYNKTGTVSANYTHVPDGITTGTSATILNNIPLLFAVMLLIGAAGALKLYTR